MVNSWATIALSAAGLAALAPGADAFSASSPATVALRRSNAVCNVAMEAAPRLDRRAVFPLAAAGLGALLFPGAAFAGEPIPMDEVSKVPTKSPDSLEDLEFEVLELFR
ncbi:hypothetical protein T484DRAFT_1859416 [Baffinella frigidus]|nr:hypothetical protein T484DRAFT_1859416 [Cryptophyta sp. CCMP2293]